MADDNDIVSKVSIEGVDDARSKLQSVGDAGVASFNKISDAASQSAAAVNASMERMASDMAKRTGQTQNDMLVKIAEQGKALHEALNKPATAASAAAPRSEGDGGHGGGGGGSAEFIHTLRHAIHALHPAAEAAGISLGELSPLMMAARGGVVALGAALAGTLVAALEKAGDAAKDAAAKLGGIAGSAEQGSAQYGELRKTAGGLGVTTSQVTGVYEELLRANQKQPLQFQLPAAGLRGIVSGGVAGTEADRLKPEESMKALTEFFSRVREEGQTSTKTMEALIKAAPSYGTALETRLQEQFNKGGGPRPFTANETLQAARDIAPEMEEKAKGADTTSISHSREKLKSAIEQQTSTGGTNIIANILDTVTAGFKSTETGGLLGKLGGQDKPTSEVPRRNLFDMLGIGAGPVRDDEGKIKNPGTFDNQIWGETTSKVEKLAEATKGLGEATGEAAKSAGDAAKEYSKKDPKTIISEERARVETERARIEDVYAKREEADKIKRDQMAVENAALGVRSSKISHEEALKGQELSKFAIPDAALKLTDSLKNIDLSRLAPATAESGLEGAKLNSEQAELSLSQLYKKIRENPRTGLEGAQDSLDIKKAEHAQKEADLAERKAEIEERYAPQAEHRAELEARKAEIEYQHADLIPQKADLEVEKTKKDITSASFEKESSELRLIKDKDLGGLNTEDKSLVYAQKMVDQFDLLSKDGNENAQAIVSKLDEVVSAISGLNKGGASYSMGGAIRGAGSGTSDSIPAMVSDGEYIHNAAAVDHYGVDFMHAVNNMKLPKFSLGGFVKGFSMPLPRFADGGRVDMSGSGPAGHYSVDLRTDHGTFQMSAPEETARQLSRHAVSSKMTSTGNKPSWYE